MTIRLAVLIGILAVLVLAPLAAADFYLQLRLVEAQEMQVGLDILRTKQELFGCEPPALKDSDADSKWLDILETV